MERAGWLCLNPVGVSIGKFVLFWLFAVHLLGPCKARVSIEKIVVPDILFEEEEPSARMGQDISGLGPATRFMSRQAASSNDKYRAFVTGSQQNGAKFDCLYSYDKIDDQNLVVKWYYEDEPEPIYQWIPELNKRFVSVKFRSHIVINSNNQIDAQRQPDQRGTNDFQSASHATEWQQNNNEPHPLTRPDSSQHNISTPSDDSHKYRGFTLTRPSKELSGKYTCTVMSALNDDSKSKKMMVYALPKLFSFNAIKQQRDSGALQQHQLHQQTMAPTMGLSSANQQQYHHNQWPEPVPVPYRLRQQPLVPNHSLPASTNNNNNINVASKYNNRLSFSGTNSIASQQTAIQTPLNTIQMPNTHINQQHQPQQQQLQEYLQRLQKTGRIPTARDAPPWNTSQAGGGSSNGVLLVCDIDQVYPMPEVSIYRLGKAANGAHPGPSLLKLDTRVERVRSITAPPPPPITGISSQQQQQIGSAYHVQVTSFVDDDELISKYGQGPSYFECLITLPNLESTRYDSKRTIVYSPGSTISGNRQLGDTTATTTNSDSTSSSSMMTANGSRPFSLLMPSATIIGTVLISAVITITSALSPFSLI